MRTKSESSKDLSYDTVYYRFEIKVGVNMRINSNNHNENMPYFNFNINDMDIFLENDSKIFKSFLHQCK